MCLVITLKKKKRDLGRCTRHYRKQPKYKALTRALEEYRMYSKNLPGRHDAWMAVGAFMAGFSYRSTEARSR